MVKPKIIFIEGVDRTGKSSLAEAIQKATNYKHVVFDRGVISNMVYSISKQRYKRENMDAYEDIAKGIGDIDNHLLIYLKCSDKELERRIKETNHEEVDFKTEKQLFELFVDQGYFHTMRADTSKFTTEEIVEWLLEEGQI